MCSFMITTPRSQSRYRPRGREHGERGGNGSWVRSASRGRGEGGSRGRRDGGSRERREEAEGIQAAGGEGVVEAG